jgi:hypothetical protein
MRHDQNSPGSGKKSERKDRLAASLRENLLRRKSQARARKAGGAADKEAEVDLEVKAIVPDTEGATEGDRQG